MAQYNDRTSDCYGYGSCGLRRRLGVPNPANPVSDLRPDSRLVPLRSSQGATQPFTATVSGTTNTAVAWSVQEGALGGTIQLLGLRAPSPPEPST